MSRSTLNLYDEILKETANCRCEYLEILIEKYVKTEDEIVDIHIRNFSVVKPTNYLKRMEEKPFGCVSSYECKSAKKNLHWWKKKIILQKRASFRRHVGVESSDGNYHYGNSKQKSNYITPSKAYKTLLTIQKDDSYSLDEKSENTLLNQTNLSVDEHSVSSLEEKDRSLSHEDSSPFQSDPVEKVQSKVFRENEKLKFLGTCDKKEFLLPKDREFSNFEIRNCDGNLLKSHNPKQMVILTEHFSLINRNKYDGNITDIKHQTMPTYLKGGVPSLERENKSSISSAFDNSKLLSDFILNKCPPKFKLSDIGIGIPKKQCQIYNPESFTASNKYYQTSYNYRAPNRLLPCFTKKSAESFKLRAYENGIFKSNSYVSSICSTKSLSYSADKSIKSSKKVSETEMQASNKATRVCSSKSVYVPSKCLESSTHKFNKTVIRTSSKNS